MSERNWQEDWDYVQEYKKGIEELVIPTTLQMLHQKELEIREYWLQEIKRLQEIETQLNQAMRNILTVTKDSGAWTTGARVAFIVNDTLRKVYGDEDKSKDTLCMD